ncbi:MAG: hypothetical protein ACK5KP_12025 [Paludibacteraceae bacterium]
MKNLKIYTFIFFALTFLPNVFSQQRNRGKFDVNKFHENKWEFINHTVSLSPAEVAVVKPVFLEYEKKNWELHKQSRELFKKTFDKEITEKEYRELNDKMINYEIKRSQYLRDYHLKLRKLLKPETLFHYYRAEKKFERQLLQERPGPKPNAGNRK